LLFGRAPLGQVTRNFCEADNLAVWASDGIDDDVRPKAASILPKPPPLALEAALLFCGPQRSGWKIYRSVFDRIEAREVVADDLVCRVTLEPFRAGIPARHKAARIEHVDCVVADPLDQHPVTPVGRLRILEIGF
jgi:hypothetical protein